MAQVTRDILKKNSNVEIRLLNQTVDYVLNNPFFIVSPKLDLSSIQLIGFSDASFVSNRNQTTQLEYIIFAVVGNNLSMPIYFKSYKVRRGLKSVLGDELIAVSDMFAYAFTVAKKLRTFHPNNHFQIYPLTDNKSLIVVISKRSRTSERRLMLDVAIV